MNTVLQIIRAILLCGIASLACAITQKDAIILIDEKIQNSTNNSKAKADLLALAVGPRSTMVNNVIILKDQDVDAIIAKYGGSEIKQKSEPTTSSSSTSNTETKVKAERCQLGDCWALPKDLQGKNIFYLAMKGQLGSSCGYHAVANAWAIESLLNEKAVITSKAVDNTKGDMGSSSSICNETIIQQAKNLGIQNLYVLGTGLTKEKKQNIYVTDKTANISFETAIANLRTKKGSAFFVCHTGGNHWFLIAIINDGTKTNILCLDSLNTAMSAFNDSRYTYLRYFDDLLKSKQSSSQNISDDEALARALQESLKYK